MWNVDRYILVEAVVSNPPHMMPEEGAQKVVRRLAVRQAWVRFPARHPYYGDPSSEQQQRRKWSGPQRL